VVTVKRIFVFLFIATIKLVAKVFYRFEVTWVQSHKLADWKQIRVFAFLNHTSLFEPLFLASMPWHFLWYGSKHVLLPIADKTMNRPVLGPLLSLLAPDVVSITRKKDETWEGFLHKLGPESVVCLAPEGRMMRANGLDSAGKPMTVRGGVADILQHIDDGYLLFAYSAGLHHVQTPGERLPRIFKKIKIKYEAILVSNFKKEIGEVLNSREFKLAVVKNMQSRREQHCLEHCEYPPHGEVN
jgi:hypothetical protein